MGLRLALGIGPVRFSVALTGGSRIRRRSRSQSDGSAAVLGFLICLLAAGVYGVWLGAAYLIANPMMLVWGLVAFVVLTIVGSLCHRSPSASAQFRSAVVTLVGIAVLGLIIFGIAMAIQQMNQPSDTAQTAADL